MPRYLKLFIVISYALFYTFFCFAQRNSGHKLSIVCLGYEMYCWLYTVKLTEALPWQQLKLAQLYGDGCAIDGVQVSGGLIKGGRQKIQWKSPIPNDLSCHDYLHMYYAILHCIAQQVV